MPINKSVAEKLSVEFSRMKTNLSNIILFNDSKFSFAVNGWSARNGRSYYGITIHFIDKDWVLQSTALDLLPSHGKHTKRKILILMCLSAWSKSKLKEKICEI